MEGSDGGGDDDEADAVDEVADNEGPAAAEVVDEEDGAELREDGEDVADALVLKGVGGADANGFVDLRREVLDGGDAGHLHGGLQGAYEEKAAEAGLVLEEFTVAFGFVLFVEGDGFADLVVFGEDPGVGLVTAGVELSERL